MQHRNKLLFLVAAAVVPEVVCANPLAKVIELLDSLTAKITQEGEEEAKAYAAFVEWCDDAATNTGFAIKTATAKKGKLEATIGEEAGEISAAGTKIEELAGSIATDEADITSAKVVRKKEATDFAASEGELMDVVDTLGRAITVIERETAKNPAAFAQTDTKTISGLVKTLSTIVDAASFSMQDKNKLLGLVQSRQAAEDDDDEPGAPAAAAYKSHSGGILDVLEDLKEKAEEQLSALRKAETNAKHNFEMLKQSLEDQIAADTKDMEETKAAKAAAEEAKATAEGELVETVKELANSKSALETVSSDCMQSAADHEATMKARAEELKVIAEAKKILLETTNGAVDQTYSFLQKGQQKTALHLHTRSDLANVEVLTLIKKLAREHHSAALAQLASRIGAIMRFGTATGQDPFAKVKELIQGLIAKLQAEAGSEATEKAYCDEQMAKTEEKKGELEYDISKLTAKLDQSISKSAGLKSEVKELQAALAALTKQQAEMDKIRQETHSDYVAAKADLESGLSGVRKALGVLREYYGSAAAAMLQSSSNLADDMKQPAMPQAHEKATGAGTSIIGILEVVESDFAKSLAAEETAEDDAAAEYEQISQENKVTKTLKEQDVKYKTAEAKSLDKAISEFTSDRDTADSELSAVLDYYSKIKERCIAKPETYEQRAARREAEIAGLKEALSILEDETVFMQRGKHGAHSHFLGLH